MSLPAGVDPDDLQYGYIPTLWICALFVALFALSTIIHLSQALYFRMWWLLPTVVLAGIGEVIGWSGRLWSSKTFLANAEDPFLMQICATIISPTPLLAANFVLLGVLIGHLEAQYSRLSPKWYTIGFCSADVVALIVQAVGGASASSAANEEDGDPSTGGKIMLGGIVVQLVAIVFTIGFASEFFYHYLTRNPSRQGVMLTRGAFDRRIQFMVLALSFSTLCIFIRSVYRTIELSDGWNDRIIQTEVYFNVLDGGMIVLAIYAINFFHPGFLLAHIEGGHASAKGSQRSSREGITMSQTGFASPDGDKSKDRNVVAATTQVV